MSNDGDERVENVSDEEAPSQGSGGQGRRQFLNVAIAGCSGALGASVLYPLARYVVPPEVVESTTNSVTLNVTTGEMTPGSGRIFRFGSDPGILVRTPAGELRAFTAICTHLACTVQYREDLAHIWCACHNGHYDLEGQNIAGPPPRPLTRYVVNVEGDQIVVSKGA